MFVGIFELLSVVQFTNQEVMSNDQTNRTKPNKTFPAKSKKWNFNICIV
jgi:hypothetical protein